MSGTPALPEWITRADIAGYTTAHRLCPNEARLYGTEDLYGDWNGRILLLAKDWGPSCMLRCRTMRGDPRPYHHDPLVRANRRLRELAEPHRQHGLLYGSALANLLRDDGRVSGSVPNRDAAIDYGTRVTRFTIDHMPNLKWIMCMGSEAWKCASAALGVKCDWREYRDNPKPLGQLVAAFHPSARVSDTRLRIAWGLLSQLLSQSNAA